MVYRSFSKLPLRPNQTPRLFRKRGEEGGWGGNEEGKKNEFSEIEPLEKKKKKRGELGHPPTYQIAEAVKKTWLCGHVKLLF